MGCNRHRHGEESPLNRTPSRGPQNGVGLYRPTPPPLHTRKVFSTPPRSRATYWRGTRVGFPCARNSMIPAVACRTCWPLLRRNPRGQGAKEERRSPFSSYSNPAVAVERNDTLTRVYRLQDPSERIAMCEDPPLGCSSSTFSTHMHVRKAVCYLSTVLGYVGLTLALLHSRGSLDGTTVFCPSVQLSRPWKAYPRFAAP